MLNSNLDKPYSAPFHQSTEVGYLGLFLKKRQLVSPHWKNQKNGSN